MNLYEKIDLTEAQARKLCEIADVQFPQPADMSWDGSGWSNAHGETMSLPQGAINKIESGFSLAERQAIEGAL